MATSQKPVVVVTGGGAGIGKAICQALCDEYETIVIDRDAANAQATAQEIGGWAIQADLSLKGENERAISKVVQRYGKLDALVLNAGIVRAGTVLSLSDEDWLATMNINLSSAFWMCRAALPYLEGQGSIVGISSLSALRVGPDLAAYAASKAAFSMLLQSIAVDFGPKGVRANTICPGWIRTPMADQEMQTYADKKSITIEEAYNQATSLTPVRRAGKPSEVAAMVKWMLSPLANYLNGAVLPLDGGLTALDPGTTTLS
ncbi:SDR family NAD(P)-dependent oxidoreductase [Pseudomonas taiwanensis]|uniref:SDR family oxidoreductase n=1 Tax=Pseudomonas taiwanensis TaxID=470150 RepID=A0ABR6V5K6_9PSED|nr:SDR family oxidoreductase [Pseudomonas taiwanensis]MBC3475674.1 SDR family oxidoreductase [Pseudomonas taiwanensis]MBC3489446.1 SDR family oxidoreductase [Pseudomonas taiwanensis]